MLGLTFSFKLDWGYYLISIARTASKKIGALIRSVKFLFPEILSISINLPYSHVQNTVVMSGLVLLVTTWNCWISYKNGYTGLLVLHLLPLLNPWLIINYRYYFGRCSSELAQLDPLPYSRGRSTCYSDRLHDFSVTIPRCYKHVYVNSFFPRTARLWNYLPI